MYHNWLVVWNMNFMTCHSVGNVMIPADFHSMIFRGGSTTNQSWMISALALALAPQWQSTWLRPWDLTLNTPCPKFAHGYDLRSTIRLISDM